MDFLGVTVALDWVGLHSWNLVSICVYVVYWATVNHACVSVCLSVYP